MSPEESLDLYTRAQKAELIGTTVRVEALAALAQAYDNVGLRNLSERARNQALEMAGDDEALKKEILYQMALNLEMQEKSEEARGRWLELFEIDAAYKDTVEHVFPPGCEQLLESRNWHCHFSRSIS